MVVKKRPDADRLQISQRIDQRMENHKRRKMNPTDWAIKDELFMNCSFTVFCPCVVSLGAHPPTEGHCHAWMAVVIDEGHCQGESLFRFGYWSACRHLRADGRGPVKSGGLYR